MARKSKESPPPGPDRIIDVDVDSEMRSSFLEYAYSVIYSRALPDARDGLKPVQRRILFQMGRMGLRPDRGHVKSARVVGEVMGRLHPHGDSAIYDALVRLAQPFTLRLPFVDGHGNFGSLDDGPAAMRYTECRLASAAMAMIADIDEDVVDFVPNYDSRETEPLVLPAEIPSLLVNGAAGIAVGMATSIPSHNLGEVLSAAHHLVLNPQASVEDLMRFVPGPDLPQGGTIVGLEGIREAYLTGRGTFKVRGTARIEQVSPRKRGIVITELPPGVGPERIIERVKDLVSAKKLSGISDIVDLTDGDSGLRLVIEVKSTVNPEGLLTELYRKTPLEDSQSFNCVALVDGEPRTLGLAEAISVYVNHRIEVVRRRSTFRRERAQERLHLVEGLLIAMLDIDEVIAVIRSSDDTAAARERLTAVFDLSDTQAAYILEMPLRRLTKFSRLELESERDQLSETITALTAILDDDVALRREVAALMQSVSDAHSTPRRTVLLESEGGTVQTPTASLDIPDEPCRVLVSSTGLIARTAAAEFEESDERSSHDLIVQSLSTSTRATLAAVTSRGRAIRLDVVDLPSLPATAHAPSLSGGVPLGALVDTEPGESIVGLITLTQTALLVTDLGTVKRVDTEPPSSKDSWSLISLKESDSVVAVTRADEGDDIVIITRSGNMLRFPAAAVRVQGNSAGGMTGITLTGDDQVLYATAVSEGPGTLVATVAGSTAHLPGTASGSVKLTDFDEVPRKGRGTQGVRIMRLRSDEDSLVVAWVGMGPARAASSSGMPVALPVELSRRDATGQRMNDPIASIASALPDR